MAAAAAAGGAAGEAWYARMYARQQATLSAAVRTRQDELDQHVREEMAATWCKAFLALLCVEPYNVPPPGPGVSMHGSPAQVAYARAVERRNHEERALVALIADVVHTKPEVLVNPGPLITDGYLFRFVRVADKDQWQRRLTQLVNDLAPDAPEHIAERFRADLRAVLEDAVREINADVVEFFLFDLGVTLKRSDGVTSDIRAEFNFIAQTKLAELEDRWMMPAAQRMDIKKAIDDVGGLLAGADDQVRMGEGNEPIVDLTGMDDDVDDMAGAGRGNSAAGAQGRPDESHVSATPQPGRVDSSVERRFARLHAPHSRSPTQPLLVESSSRHLEQSPPPPLFS